MFHLFVIYCSKIIMEEIWKIGVNIKIAFSLFIYLYIYSKTTKMIKSLNIPHNNITDKNVRPLKLLSFEGYTVY